jgi:NAD kinase
VVGADWLVGGAQGRSAIHTGWECGPELWKSSHFAVLTRPGHALKKEDLPPNAKLLTIDIDSSSSHIRELLMRGEDATKLLTPGGARYIERYGLYRGNNPATWSRGSMRDWRGTLQADERNAKAMDWAERLAAHCNGDQADYILTLGGDGTMLRTIREHWRRRLPFFGINAGHLGFLMNAPEEVLEAPFPPTEVIFRQLPLLFIELQLEDGTQRTEYAFNDAWVERSTSQSAWMSVKVNDEPRMKKLVADGALVSTAAGSTAYARSMGASPLLADTPAWLLVGSNVMEPLHWKSALLSTDSCVEICNLEPEARPIIAFVDGIPRGPVRSMRARLSRAASAELVFLASRDMAEKIAAIQFQKI